MLNTKYKRVIIKLSGEALAGESGNGIAAKDINQTIYVAAGYKSGSTNHCTGVLPYSIGTYCASLVSKATAAKELAAATAVYGYYANAYFNG